MKKGLFFSLVLISSLNAGIFDSVSNAWSGASNTVGNATNKVTNSTVADKATSGSWDLSDISSMYNSYGKDLGLETIFGSQALEKLKGLGSGANLMYKYCYSFSSPSLDNPFSIMNPCDLANINMCASAPDLSALGFKKISGANLSRYCESIGKGSSSSSSSTIPKKPITENIKKITTNQVLKDRYSKVKNIRGSNGSGGSSGGGSSGSSSTKSTASIVNGGEKQVSGSSIDLANNKENLDVQNIYYQNNYQGYKLLSDANSISDDSNAKIDLTKLSNGYLKIEDYIDSTNALTEVYTENENNINLTYLKNTAELVFANINSTTTVVSEQEQQKEAEASNLLNEYKKQIELWKVSEMQKRIWLNTKEKEQIISPTDEMLDSINDVPTRISMVYYGEKNKNERAEMLAEVESQAFSLIERAKNIIKMAQVNSRQFDRTAEYNKILQSLSSLK